MGETDVIQFWEHNGGRLTWVKTTLQKLSSPPDQLLKSHLHCRIAAATEVKQHWSKLPANCCTHHIFTILEAEDSDLFVSLERKDDQLGCSAQRPGASLCARGI